jgi:hypothetical protein
MAKVKLSPLLSSVSGRIGSTVFRRQGSNLIAYQSARKTKSSLTSKQQKNQWLFAYFTALYAKQSAATKAAWASVAASGAISSAITGETFTQARQCYVGYHMLLFSWDNPQYGSRQIPIASTTAQPSSLSCNFKFGGPWNVTLVATTLTYVSEWIVWYSDMTYRTNLKASELTSESTLERISAFEKIFVGGNWGTVQNIWPYIRSAGYNPPVGTVVAIQVSVVLGRSYPSRILTAATTILPA